MSNWVPGQRIIQPGSYIRVTNFGDIPLSGATQGVVAIVAQTAWGPLGTSVILSNNLQSVDDTFGVGAGTDTIREAIRGGALQTVVVRPGTGGVKASRTLADGLAAIVGNATAKYVGTRGNNIYLTIRTSLATTGKEAVIYELSGGVYTPLQTIPFPAGGGDEMGALVAAAASMGSPWVDFNKTATGNGVLAGVTLQALNTTAGTNPVVVASDYTAALGVLEMINWNVCCLDTVDTTIQASAQAWIDRIVNQGKRRILVVAEPTSVPIATRIANCRNFNDPHVRYVLNAFTGLDGVARDGALAGARYAGMVAGSRVTQNLTFKVVDRADTVTGPLNPNDADAAVLAGAVFFTANSRGAVVIRYDLTTFNTPNAVLDAGWMSGRRQRERDALLNAIDADWENLIGDIDNSVTGRNALIQHAKSVAAPMIDADAFSMVNVYVDPSQQPQGDICWFVVEIDDIDSANKIMLTTKFRYAPPALPVRTAA
jgi:hypothetical protein